MRLGKARWQSGHAADCKSVNLGSTPGRASKNLAQVVKSVDTRDLKSLGCKAVRVQVPLWAPKLENGPTIRSIFLLSPDGFN